MIEFWRLCIVRDLEIYKNLTLFSECQETNMLTSHFWIPQSQIRKPIQNRSRTEQELWEDVQTETDEESSTQFLQQRLQVLTKGYPGAKLEIERVDPKKATPNYFEENEFMFGFQEIVNTYGVPRYKELNPAVFTAVTFPF